MEISLNQFHDIGFIFLWVGVFWLTATIYVRRILRRTRYYRFFNPQDAGILILIGIALLLIPHILLFLHEAV